MVLIRGNIRQQYLPFVIQPGSNLNANVTDDHGCKDGPQLFSFRNKNAGDYKAGFGLLNICPSVMRAPDFGLMFNKDISNRLLYDYESKGEITIDSIFNRLPGVQIREFQVDAKLDQFINLFFELFQSAKGLFKEFKLSDAVGAGSDAARDRWISMIRQVLTTVWNYCMNQGKFQKGPNMMEDKSGKNRWEAGKDSGTPADGLKNGPLGGSGQSALNLDTYLMDFPFMMYYRLQSCTTLNIYELPYSGQDLWSSDGNQGWQNASMGLKDLTGGGDGAGGMMSKIANMFVGGLGDLINRAKINYMPKWDPTGEGTVGEVTVTFDLFNDTAEAAMMNFIFVNTIIPNNLWMQYGMLKHSPCLYDVKIEGVKRMFLCSGKFRVKAGGMMRTPPLAWVRDLCAKHANGKGKTDGSWSPEKLAYAIMANNLVKIPDVYTVEMTFTSLIPENFNNFLFNYSRNSGMELYVNKDAHHPSVIGEILGSIKTDLSEEVKNVIEKGNKDIAKIRAEEEKNKNNKENKPEAEK